ncbi:hypothetical protein F441_16205 [Phytophthora nicotianae CJ01A1]|uniref:Uncharacterized protein n=1 Tax=Phytophthora nicotianae CJ01A1 TaxID=1317063 RepID=W2WD08_PHYNI|nr:hypothetical protein F441_16205 [Phytophthora nicotianae CJ01A1]
MMNALDANDVELVRWLHETILDEDNERKFDHETRFSLRNGDGEIAEILMSKGRCVLDYAPCERVKMIEMLVPEVNTPEFVVGGQDGINRNVSA